MQVSLTDLEKSIFEKVASAAVILQYPTYVVGGFVRDKILDKQEAHFGGSSREIIFTNLSR
mgnify:CR=1 FL=1